MNRSPSSPPRRPRCPQPPNGGWRQGTAVVELAMALPLLFIIVFGSIQACNALFSQQFITEVTYQGAIAASRPDATHAAVVDDMNQLLSARGLGAATVELVGIDGAEFDALVAGDLFRVQILLDSSINQAGPAIAQYTQLQAESCGRKQ